MIANVRVEREGTNSVQVTWERINVPGITSYTVFYSTTGTSKRQFNEQSVTIPSSESSVVIMSLVSNVEYKFQVVAIGTLNGQDVVGDRSVLSSTSMIIILQPSSCGGNLNKSLQRWPRALTLYLYYTLDENSRNIAITAVSSSLLSIMLYTLLLLAACGIIHLRNTNSSWTK